jgi:hypothetical protein
VSAQRDGNMLVRVDPDQSDALAEDPHVETIVMRGREMTGWLTVDSKAVEDDDVLHTWVERGVGFASSLPAK